jgi:SRSO17 transposase
LLPESLHLYLEGLLSHLDRKNAEDIAALVDVERLVLQEFIGTTPWDHRPLVQVLVGQVVHRLGEPDGIIAFDPSSFPKRGTHSVGVKRQWRGHRGKVDNCQVGVFMGYVSRHDHALLDFRLYLSKPTVSLDVISLVASSCGYDRAQIEQRAAQ